MNFLTGYYGFRHEECGGQIKIDKIGVSEYEKLVVLGTCQACWETDVVTLIPLRNLKKCAQELRTQKVTPITARGAFTIKDCSDLHRLGVCLPTGEERK